MKAAFYYRATELFTTREDPDKKLLYDKCIGHFYKAFQDEGIKKYEVPYNNTFLPAIQIQPVNQKKRRALLFYMGGLILS